MIKKTVLNKSRDRVEFAFGLTKNLGSYESLRVDGKLSSDVLPGETMDKAMNRLKLQLVPEVMQITKGLADKMAAELPPPPPERWRARKRT